MTPIDRKLRVNGCLPCVQAPRYRAMSLLVAIKISLPVGHIEFHQVRCGYPANASIPRGWRVRRRSEFSPGGCSNVQCFSRHRIKRRPWAVNSNPAVSLHDRSPATTTTRVVDTSKMAIDKLLGAVTPTLNVSYANTQPPPFGHQLLDYFSFDPGYVNLNNG